MEILEIQGETAEERTNWLRALLTDGTYIVTFTKLNGEIRTMPCTLSSRLLPPQPVAESHPTFREVDNETLRVWCVDLRAWRSFRVMNITEVKVDSDAGRKLY